MPHSILSLPVPRARLVVLGLAVALATSGCAQLKGRQGYVVDPVEDECEHQIDHVEAAVERVGNASLRIPVRRARGGDDGVPQRAACLARVGFGSEEFAER